MTYTPANVALHLGGPELGALRYDIREPKHPYTDKFMLAGGHCIPTCYALWMILYEAIARQFESTGDERYKFNPKLGILSIDALGFRRSPAACATMLKDNGLEGNPLFAQAKIRGIRYLQGHAETTDVTSDVNGGPSGVGFATAAGKALFWDAIGAPDSPKIWVLEGEFAMTEGHAQELKTIALAQQVGKRLRLFLSYNNAGIDDNLNVRVVAVISEELFNLQPGEYRHKVLPDPQRFDCMVITTMTKRIMPLSNLGPLTEEYSLSADFDDRWRTGGTEDDVIREARLDEDSVFEGIKRFVSDREQRLKRQIDALKSLGV